MFFEGPAPQPPPKDELEDVIAKFKKERVELLSEMYKRLAELYSIERDLMIYRLVKQGDIGVYKVARVVELTPAMIYKIIERIENGRYDETEVAPNDNQS